MQSTANGEIVASHPRISVVLPTRNSETYLEEAIDSLLAQTFSDFELIVVDDNSTDKTLTILSKYKEKDSRVKVIGGPGKGLAAALNAGMHHAMGEFIARMDADDIARETRFQKQVELLDANMEIGGCGTLFQQFHDGNDLHVHMEKVRYSDLLYGCYIGHPTAMFRRQLFIDHGLFYNETLKFSEDYELWSRAARVMALGNVPENLLWYRRHGKSTSVVHVAEMTALDVSIKLDMITYLVGDLNAKDRDILRNVIECKPLPETDREMIVAKVMNLIRFPELCSRFELLSYFHQLKEFSDGFLRRVAAETLRDMNYFVISYNHLTYVKSIVSHLQSIGAKNVSIIDNDSSYPPLKDYLKTCPYRVYYMHKNYGHMVLFECPIFKETIDNTFFVLTDPDILPVSECPSDYLLKFFEILLRYPTKNKAGFSLKIDDLPDHYALKDNVILWEKKFYTAGINRRDLTIYDAHLDTTLALYRPRREWRTNNFYEAYRIGPPYTARHLPWYRNLAQLSDEEAHYVQNDRGSSNWNGTLSSEDLHRKYGTAAAAGDDNAAAEPSCDAGHTFAQFTGDDYVIRLNPEMGDASYQKIIVVKSLKLFKRMARIKRALMWPLRNARKRHRKQIDIAKSISRSLRAAME